MTGLQYGYINDVFGLIRNDDECATRFGFPVVKFDLVKSEPKIWFDPSTTNRIRYSITLFWHNSQSSQLFVCQI